MGGGIVRKTVKIRGREIPLLVLVVLVILLVVGIVAALVQIGVIRIGYKITPAAAEAPTMSPSTLNLDLGTIPSGSSDSKDFGKVATLTLPVGYEITFTLDQASAANFPTFNVGIAIYKPGDTYTSYVLTLLNSDLFNTDSQILPAGDYNVHVSVDYTAKSVTTETTGTVLVSVSYPG